MCGMTRHSTSPPCGNLVERLPHALPHDWGPRTQVVLTMKNILFIRISSTSGRRSDMIVLDKVLRIWIE